MPPQTLQRLERGVRHPKQRRTPRQRQRDPRLRSC